MKLDRRSFLAAGLLGTLSTLLPRALANVLGYPRALQGPMVGTPGPRHFTVWARASGAFEVRLEYSTDRDFRNVLAGSSAVANRKASTRSMRSR